MKRLLALTASLLLLSGCVPHEELDKRGLAEAVGVDFADGTYTVTVQYFNTDASGGVTAVDSSAPNVMVASGSGRTIETALQAVSYTSGSSIMLGAASFIVFGEDAAFSLDDALSLASSHYCGNLRAYVAAARGKAADIMNVKFSEGNASVEKLRSMMRNVEELGLSRPVFMYEAQELLCGETESAALPLLQAYPSGQDMTEDGMSVVVAGGAVITDGKYAGELGVREMSGLQMLSPGSGSTHECELTLLYRGKDTRVTLYGITPHIKTDIRDGKLVLDIKVNADCKIVSTAIPDPYPVRRDIERLCEEEISGRVKAVLDGSLRKYGADIFGLEYDIRSQSPEIWNALNGDLREHLKDCIYSVSADVRMERYGMLGR